jgi:hypothetical protein
MRAHGFIYQCGLFQDSDLEELSEALGEQVVASTKNLNI